jgi:hypothetical protein
MMSMEMVSTQEPVMTTRLQLVEVLEGLRDVLVQIDNQTVDRRYVDFAAIAERLGQVAVSPVPPCLRLGLR